MSKLSLDHTLTRCICLHSDEILVPSLISVLETNGIAVDSINQPPQNQNWLEDVSYLVWSGSPPFDPQEIENLIKLAIARNIKLLILIPLDIWYNTKEKFQQNHSEITNLINRIDATASSRGDIRTILYAGIWSHQTSSPNTIIGHLINQLHHHQFPLLDAQIIYPLEVSIAVQSIFSHWFNRGHRGKRIVLSGSPIFGKNIKDNIDTSNLSTEVSPIFYDRETGLSYTELIETPSNNSDFFTYLKNSLVNQPPPPPTIFTPPPIFTPPSPRQVVKTEVPTPLPRPAKPKRRGVNKNLLIGLCLILIINLPNLYLLAHILLARSTNLDSKETIIPTRHQQLLVATEIVASTTAKIPLLGEIGDSLINWSSREQNQLLTLKIQALLVRVAKHMINASPGDPFEKLQEAKHSLDELYFLESIQTGNSAQRDWIIQARKVVELLPQLIPPDKKITILLLLQNNLELRPTGGFIGAVAILSFDHGKLLTIDTRDIYDLDSNLKGLVNPPPELKTYLGESSWYFRDSNWSPNFIESAASANWFLEKEWGSPADIVIGINLNTLKTLLAATGPISLPNGTIIENNNLLATAFNHQDVPIAKPGAGKQEFLSQLIRPLIDSFSQASPKTATQFLSALAAAASGGELTLTSSQPAVLSEIIDMGWSGSLQPSKCSPTFSEPCQIDSLAVNEANVGINKTNFYLTRSLNHTIQISPSVAQHTHRITFTNNSPNNTWPGGSYKAFIRVILPPEASNLSVSIDGQPTTLSSSSSMPGFFIEVKSGATLVVALNYSVALTPSLATYKFQLIKQPGVSSDPITLSITPPPGRSLESLTSQLFDDTNLSYTGVFDKSLSAAFALTP